MPPTSVLLVVQLVGRSALLILKNSGNCTGEAALTTQQITGKQLLTFRPRLPWGRYESRLTQHRQSMCTANLLTWSSHNDTGHSCKRDVRAQLAQAQNTAAPMTQPSRHCIMYTEP